MGVMKEIIYASKEQNAMLEAYNLVFVDHDGNIDGNLLLTDRPASILMMKPMLIEDLYDFCREVTAMGHEVNMHVSGNYNWKAWRPNHVDDMWRSLELMCERKEN